MKLAVGRQPLTRMLHWIRRTLFAFAVAMLGYCSFVMVDSWTYQNRERRQLEHLPRDQHEASRGARQTDSPASPKASQPATNGTLVGRIDIPRLRLSVIVAEGTSRATLRRAAGHIPGTALPGQPGNVGISGHRDTFFRPLRNIRQNDIITLSTLLGEYRYRVVSARVVGPNDITVLDPSGEEVLTLVTCYPFYFVGPAPDRFIVRAERIIQENPYAYLERKSGLVVALHAAVCRKLPKLVTRVRVPAAPCLQ